MKVMQINCVYNTGSTGKIVYDIHAELKKQEVESVVCYGRGKNANEKGVYKTSSEILAKFNNVKSRITGCPYNGSFFATGKLLSIIKKEKPDVVHLHCINGFFVNIYRLVSFLKKRNIPTVVTHHAEFLYTGNCPHAYECERWKNECGNCPDKRKAVNSFLFDRTKHNFKRMEKTFSGFKNLYSVAVSPWVQERAEQSPIFKDAIHTTVLNGIDTNVFRVQQGAEVLREKLGIGLDKKIVLYVTASMTNPTKGGHYVLELAEKLGEEYRVLIVGNHKMPENLPSNVIAVGRVENQTELAKFYTLADVTVITSKRETFSMPVAESLCCGTPVAGFKAGGPETISIKEFSRFVNFGNITDLYNAVIEIINRVFVVPIEETSVYMKKTMTYKYLQVYREVVNNEKK